MVCSCAPMFKFSSVLPDGATIEYEISNRGISDFLHSYYCDFLNNVCSGVCSFVVMGSPVRLYIFSQEDVCLAIEYLCIE